MVVAQAETDSKSYLNTKHPVEFQMASGLCQLIMPCLSKSYTWSLPKMIGPAQKKLSVRIAGYLEKRGKTRLVMCRWKRLWFVLEGRLLLYYKSQLEYLNLSPCRGSLNMGLASTVRPGKNLELTVVTRSQCVTLRAANKVDHEHWLQSLLDAMALPHLSQNHSARPFMHFRYLNQDHENVIERVRSFKSPSYSPMKEKTSHNQSGSCETSTTCSNNSSIEQSQSDKCLLRRVFSDSRTLLRRPYKRNSDRSSTHLSKLALSDTSIPVSMQAISLSPAGSSDKCHSMQELRNSVRVSSENVQAKGENISKLSIETDKPNSKENRQQNSIKIELSLEDVGSKSGETIEQKIGNIKIVLDGCAIYGSRKSSTGDVSESSATTVNRKVLQNGFHHAALNSQLNRKVVKSDSELSPPGRLVKMQSLSCENLHTLDRSLGSTYQDICTRLDQVNRGKRIQVTSPEPNRKTNKRRSNSILSRFTVSKNDAESGTLEGHRTIRKRLSFLRKVWKKREKKPEAEEEDFESIDYESIPIVIELPSPEDHKAEELLTSLRQEEMVPEPEPPPDYDTSISEELEIPPLLPPRQKQRPASPWHDIPKNNKPVVTHEDRPPPLPMKQKKMRTHQVFIQINQESSSSTESSLGSSDLDTVNCEPPSQDSGQKLEDLDTLLIQLSEVNTYVVQQIDLSQAECLQGFVQVSAAQEPIYDTPRPHISLIATLRQQNVYTEEITATNFLCTTPLVDMDSLDPVTSRLDAEMTPDSLECDLPWSLPNSESQSPSDSTNSLQSHFIMTEDKVLQDSLNSS